VVPSELAGERLEKLTDYYADDPNVTVIVDRRRRDRRGARGDAPGSDQRERRDRRRARVAGEFPPIAGE
jgi:hypothetical protein